MKSTPKIVLTPKKKIGIYLIGILLLLLPLLLLKITGTRIVYYNNDDIYMQEICSGVMTGTPNSHLIFIGHLTGLGLSGLYKLFPSVPWYGLWLFLCMYGSIVYIICRLSTFFQKVKNKLFFFAGAAFTIWFCWLQHIVELQFTTITATVATAGFVSMLCSKDSEKVSDFLKNNIVSILFFFIAFELRYNACVMILLACIVYAGIKIIKNKKMLPALISYMGILVTGIFLLWSIEKIAYSSEEWQNYQRYTVARATLLDYKGYPDYATYKQKYEELGISEVSYNAARSRYLLLLDENIDAEAFEYLNTLEPLKKQPKTFAKDFIKLQYLSKADYPLNIIVFFLYISAIILVFAAHKKNYLWEILGLFFSRNAIWVYLILGGRIVPWVTQGIYIMEVMVLSGILIRNRIWQHLDTVNQKKYCKILTAVTVIGILVCLFTGIPNTGRLLEQNKNHQQNTDEYRTIRQYCDAHPENLYLIDLLSAYYFNDFALDATITASGNMVLLGGWPTNSPWTTTIAQKYDINSYLDAITKKDNIYFIFKDTPSTGYEYLESYLADNQIPGQLTVDEIVNSQKGEKFFILKLAK